MRKESAISANSLSCDPLRGNSTCHRDILLLLLFFVVPWYVTVPRWVPSRSNAMEWLQWDPLLSGIQIYLSFVITFTGWVVLVVVLFVVASWKLETKTSLYANWGNWITSSCYSCSPHNCYLCSLGLLHIGTLTIQSNYSKEASLLHLFIPQLPYNQGKQMSLLRSW